MFVLKLVRFACVFYNKSTILYDMCHLRFNKVLLAKKPDLNVQMSCSCNETVSFSSDSSFSKNYKYGFDFMICRNPSIVDLKIMQFWQNANWSMLQIS